MIALVLGGADCVWSDVEQLEALLGGEWPGLVIAVNDIGCHWPRHIDHWVTLHPPKLARDGGGKDRAGWVEQRRRNGHPDGYVTWSKRAHRLVDRTVRPFHGGRPFRGGASGMLALIVAKELGVTRCVLAGVPMTPTPHFAESAVHVKGRKWSSASTHWKAWLRNMDWLQPWVRSMSGQTREHLGAPTLEWLEGEG